jgi:hypothetical protein
MLEPVVAGLLASIGRAPEAPWTLILALFALLVVPTNKLPEESIRIRSVDAVVPSVIAGICKKFKTPLEFAIAQLFPPLKSLIPIQGFDELLGVVT